MAKITNHFDFVPGTVGRKRSIFKYHKEVTTGSYVGFLYPMCKPVDMLPGSYIDLKQIVAEVMSDSLIRPLFNELYLDVFAFFVPNRIVWEHWKQYLGSTDDTLYDNLTEYQKPYINYKLESGFGNRATGQSAFRIQQSLAANFELPAIISSEPVEKIDALPYRGYTFIWNQNFRPEQLANPVLFSKGDRGNAGDNVGANFALSVVIGGEPYIIPTPGSVSGSNPDTPCSGGVVLPVFRVSRDIASSALPKPSLETLNLLSSVDGFPEVTDVTVGSTGQTFISPTDATDANWTNVMLTVNNYRETIMLQNYYDALNRGGSRYQEIMYNIFGTRPKDAIIDIPELIIQKRFTIFRNKVVSTADTMDGDNGESVGSQHGNIDTVVKDSFFRYTAFEHGYLHIDYCIRAARITQADGVEMSWKKLTRMAEYYPQFDGMGDISIQKDLVWTYGSEAARSAVFGFVEYGVDYKVQRNSAIGWVNPNLSAGVKGYTLASASPSSAPVLKGELYGYTTCMNEFAAFAECLTIVSPEVSPQFIIHWRLDGTITHPLPVYNIPGNGALL